MSQYEIGTLARLAAQLEQRDPAAADSVLYALYVLRRMPVLDRQWGFVEDDPAPTPFIRSRLATPTAPSSVPRSAA